MKVRLLIECNILWDVTLEGSCGFVPAHVCLKEGRRLSTSNAALCAPGLIGALGICGEKLSSDERLGFGSLHLEVLS